MYLPDGNGAMMDFGLELKRAKIEHNVRGHRVKNDTRNAHGPMQSWDRKPQRKKINKFQISLHDEYI